MNYKSPQISIAILAGGKSSRMGKNKVLLTYGGKTFLEKLIEEFSDFDQILVSAKDENQYDLEKAGGKIRLITDEKQEKAGRRGRRPLQYKPHFRRKLWHIKETTNPRILRSPIR